MNSIDQVSFIILSILKKNDRLMTRNELLTELRQHLEHIGKTHLWEAFPNPKIEDMFRRGMIACHSKNLEDIGLDEFEIGVSGCDYIAENEEEAALLGIVL